VRARAAALPAACLLVVAGWAVLAEEAAPADLKNAPPAGRAEARLENPPPRLTIGDPLTLLVTPEGVAGGSLQEASLDPEALRPFVLLGVEKRDGGALALRIAAGDTGRLEVPALTIAWRDATGKDGAVRTSPVPVDVVSVLEGGETEIADIRPPADIRPDWVALLPVAAVLAGALAAATALFLWWRRRRRRVRPVAGLESLRQEDPWEWARAALDRLSRAGLLEKAEMRVFCIRLSELVREYLDRRYLIPAPERTTAEISGELERAFLDEEVRRVLTGLLWACDEVKFAGTAMLPDEGRRLLQGFASVLQTTRPTPPAVASSEPSAQAAAS